MTTDTHYRPNRFRAAPWLLVGSIVFPVLLAAGCGFDFSGRGSSNQQAAQPAAEQPAPPPAAQQSEPASAPPPPAEMAQQPPTGQPASVEAPEPPAQVAPPAPAAAARVEDLAARERRLKAREAEVRAREAEIAAREAEVAQRDEETTVQEPAAEETVARAEPAPQPPAPPPPPPMVEARLDAGTAVDVEFVRTLSSATARVGDTFRTRVQGDVYDDRGTLAIPAGAEIVGVVTQATPMPKVGGRASLGLKFTDVVLPSGDTVKISASFVEQGKSETGRDAATIGGATAGGAILGRILDRGRGSKSRGTVLGAIIGAAAGVAIASKNPGEEIEIPAGAVVALKLDSPVQLMVPQRR